MTSIAPTAGMRLSRTPPGSYVRPTLLVLLAILLSTGIASFDRLADLELAQASIWCVSTSALSYLYVVLSSPRGFWSITSVFLLVACFFHLGLLLYPISGTAPQFEGTTGIWFTTTATVTAVIVVSCAIMAFAICAGGRAARQSYPSGYGQDDAGHLLGVLGLGMLLVGVVLWVLLAVRALGPFFFLSSYRQYLAATDGQPLPWIFFAIGLGAVLCVASKAADVTGKAAIVFFLFALMALPIGLRGEVLFPLAAATAVAARSRRMPRSGAVIMLLVMLLTAISLLQQIRQDGLGGTSASELSATPVRGVAELGGSLRTVQAVISWRAMDGPDTLRGGDTYVAPFDRAIRGRLIDGTVPPAAQDNRLFNVEMRNRETTIGGSFIAEAYRNFGLPGIIAVPALIGLCLRRLDGWRPSAVGDAVSGVVVLALLQHVRNSFTPVPLQIALGCAVIAVAAIVGRSLARSALQRRPRG